VAVNFDQHSEHYRELLASHTATDLSDVAFFAGRKAHHLRRALPRDVQLRRILDYGCGIGLAWRPLKQAFPEASITAVDPSIRSLEIAAAEHRDLNIALIPLSDFEANPELVGFDGIVVSCVLHHIDTDQQQAVLDGLRQRCSPQGWIAVFEHNPYNPLTRKAVRSCPLDQGVSLIPAHSMRRLLKRAGWRRIQQKFITFVPPALSGYQGIEEWLPWCPLGGQYMVVAQPA
jgi:2-polyprenyl-3-methyl-5-hydroxy-6-metoxy-1,4-benzoquinol methylase